MEEFHLSIYISEVKRLCDSATIAYETIHKETEQVNHDLLWFCIQSFLTTTANLSKLFFPQESNNPRGKILRDTFGISENSQIRSKEVRNAFEHYDEKLDGWIDSLQKNNNSYYVDRVLTDQDGNHSNAIIINGKPPIIQRSYNSKRKVLTFRNKHYNLGKVYKEIQEIDKKVKELNSKRFGQ